ncbi:hypothetical protein CNR22_19555 [Sphingobacteriaceae bacterium]|nr:hypothetical protein CNR22_19555 [Sphingobacteriaceae bacterium]
MTTVFKIIIGLLLVLLFFPAGAQTISICAGTTTVISAQNSQNLTNASYSLNPGGLVSSNPSFTVSPLASTVYTLYVTGTNSNSLLVTTINNVYVQVSGVAFNLVSPNSFSLGCGTKSVGIINIVNAQTIPISGGPISYTFLPPGSSSVIPGGPLGSVAALTLTTPGLWTIVVRDNTSLCESWSSATVTLDNAAPTNSIQVPNNVLSCAVPTVTLSTNAVSGVSCYWLTSNGSGPVYGNSLNASVNLAAPSQSILGTYTLVATKTNNTCEFMSSTLIYQNIYKPNAVIYAPNFSFCTPTVVLTNQSTSAIPPGIFPKNLPVIVQQWQGPAGSGSSTTVFVANTSGTYTMVVEDSNNGCINVATVSVVLGASPAFVHTITSGQATFNDVSMSSSVNASYFWDFGDGTSSTFQNPTHTYLNTGAYLVKFKITNSMLMCSDSVIQSVNISGIACTANSNFSLVPTATAQVWNVIPTYPWNVSAATWSWGDGSSSNTLYTSHQYAAAGMYSICLTVTVSCGDVSTSCTSYSVYRTTEEAKIVFINVMKPGLVAWLSETRQEALSWSIAPNPNAGEFTLFNKGDASDAARIFITDLTGRVVYAERNLQFNSLIKTGLPQGVYLVTLETQQARAVKRIVILH